MSQQVINVGSGDANRDGDLTRIGWTKANANFTELYAFFGGTGSSLIASALSATPVNNFDPGLGFPTAISRLDFTITVTDVTLTGLKAGIDGQTVLIRNLAASTNNLILPYANTGSLAANRWIGPTGQLMLMPGFRTYAVYYSSGAGGWSIG